MRTIKFRVWQKHKKRMLSWEEIQEWRFNDIEFPDTQCVFLQFTGLLDKNRVEVYEGDIIDCETKATSNLIVEYRDIWGKYVLVGHKGEHRKFFNSIQRVTRLSVIGNIWENPELLS